MIMARPRVNVPAVSSVRWRWRTSWSPASRPTTPKRRASSLRDNSASPVTSSGKSSMPLASAISGINMHSIIAEFTSSVCAPAVVEAQAVTASAATPSGTPNIHVLGKSCSARFSRCG